VVVVAVVALGASPVAAPADVTADPTAMAPDTPTSPAAPRSAATPVATAAAADDPVIRLFIDHHDDRLGGTWPA